MEEISSTRSVKPTSKLLFGGLILFFLLEYMRPGSYFPIIEVARLNSIVPFAVFVLTFLSRDGRANSDILKLRSSKWMMLFLCLFPIQVFTADIRMNVVDIFKVVLSYLLIYFAIIKQVNNIGRIKAVFITLVGVHIALVILNPGIVLQPEQRHYLGGVTFLGDGNDFAWSVCIVVPFAIYMIQTSKNKIKKTMYLGAACLLILAVVGTQSRGASIALAVSLLYLLLKGKKKVLGLVGIASLVVLVTVFAPQAYFDRMNTIRNYETEGSAQGRIMAWKSAVRMAIDHPLIGVGAGHFAVKYGMEYRPPGVGRTDIPWSNAHSIYFMALGEYGLPGIFILLGLIISNLLRNEQRIRERANPGSSALEAGQKLAVATKASFIGFAVGGVFLSGLYYPHLFILAALMESVDLTISTLPSATENGGVGIS
jgi:putative inorganic carbon (HCO3(-)) transporter